MVGPFGYKMKLCVQGGKVKTKEHRERKDRKIKEKSREEAQNR